MPRSTPPPEPRPPAAAAPLPRPPSALLGKKGLGRLLRGLAALYPLSLLAVALAFRLIGERWWPIAVGLYLPRLPLLLPLPVLLGALLFAGERRWFWGLLATALPIFLGLMGFVLPWPVRRDPGAPAIRLLSCNVDSSRAGPRAIVAAIAKHAPDFVVLQEIGGPYELGKRLRASYPTVRNWDQFIIASRFPMTPSADADHLHDFEARQEREGAFATWWWRLPFETPLGPLTIFDVHPLTPRQALDTIREGVREDWLRGHRMDPERIEAVDVNTGLREAQVADIAEVARAQRGAVLVVGDTNLPALSRILARKLGSLHDGFAQAGWGFGYTFPTTLGTWMRIDRMLANDRLRFVSFEVDDAGISDHTCIVAEVQAVP